MYATPRFMKRKLQIGQRLRHIKIISFDVDLALLFISPLLLPEIYSENAKTKMLQILSECFPKLPRLPSLMSQKPQLNVTSTEIAGEIISVNFLSKFEYMMHECCISKSSHVVRKPFALCDCCIDKTVH